MSVLLVPYLSSDTRFMNHICRYEQGWSKTKGFKAFSLISDKHIFSAELAITKGWDKPYTEKIEDPVKYGLLTPGEDDIRRGIVQLKDDSKRPKAERGG